MKRLAFRTMSDSTPFAANYILETGILLREILTDSATCGIVTKRILRLHL